MARYARLFLHPRLLVAVACLLLIPHVVAAQSSSAFTAEDILKVASISILDVSEDGQRIAASVRRPIDNETTDHRRYGDPSYLPPSRVTLQIIDARTGAVEMPFKQLVNVRDVAWSRDGKQLAILLANEPPTADGFPATTLHIWNVATKSLTAVKLQGTDAIAVNSNITWTPDGSAIFAALRNPELDREARQRFHLLTEGPVVVHKSSDPFLEWDALNRSARSRSVVTIDVRTGAVSAAIPQNKLTSYQPSRDGAFLTVMEDVTEKTDYDTIGGTENVLKYVDAKTGDSKVLMPASELKGVQLRWSDDGRWFAYAKKGEVFVQGVDGSKARSLTPKPKPDPEKAAADKATDKAAGSTGDSEKDKKDEESFSVVGFSRDGSKLLITSRKGWYAATAATGTRDLIVPMDEDEEKNPRLSLIDWAPDGSALYATWAARSEWQRGIVRIDVAGKSMTPVVRDGRLYNGVRLSRDGSTFVFTLSDGDRAAELHAADVKFSAVKKLSDLNPWMSAKALPKSELVAYRDVDGKQLYGVLRYPVGYQKGQTYPTVFEIYETFFDNGFNGRAAFLANHGYAVFHPSVNLVIGRPGEAWVKGVTSAANKLIDVGIADPDRLGVHGTSYGGYATALLITQTDRFKAAINISGKVNMVSFYTDSPRLGVRNTHAPEKSQDRIGGTLWEYPERYLEHSAVLHADRVKTPLLNITGDQDPNVPASQSREMYYALRRLGKEVEWVRYVNGGHRPPNSTAESIDFEQRILGWYDKYLKKDQKKKDTNTPQ
jgi:dipeptidyl aminopeptidase/acylaminoacyl peptidase